MTLNRLKFGKHHFRSHSLEYFFNTEITPLIGEHKVNMIIDEFNDLLRRHLVMIEGYGDFKGFDFEEHGSPAVMVISEGTKREIIEESWDEGYYSRKQDEDWDEDDDDKSKKQQLERAFDEGKTIGYEEGYKHGARETQDMFEDKLEAEYKRGIAEGYLLPD